MRATAWQILVVTAFISLDARAADIELTFTPTYWITEKWALSIDMQGHSFLDVTFQLPAVDPARHEIVSAEIEVFSGAAAGHYCLPIICLLDSGGIVLTVDWTGPLPHSASKDTGWIRPAIGKSAGLLAYSDGPFSLDPNALYSGPVEFGARATASYYAGVAGDAGAFVWTGHFFEATYRLNCLQQPCTFDPNVAPSPEPSADFGNWDPNITIDPNDLAQLPPELIPILQPTAAVPALGRGGIVAFALGLLGLVGLAISLRRFRAGP